jgi:hypothetical protein
MAGLDWLTTEPYGQTTLQIGELTLEREFRMKSAGLRTNTCSTTRSRRRRRLVWRIHARRRTRRRTLLRAIRGGRRLSGVN